MKTVAIIAEYNPFHNGHLHQIKKIREEFGDDTAIVAIMSGNFTQRGEVAIMEKWSRAEAAVRCGVNLVLELPFPYSSASAEFFARAGVHIADKINIIDFLSFGSERGELAVLETVADNMLCSALDEQIKNIINTEYSSELGYATIRELAYEKLFEKKDILSTPNNILAIEYIKAIKEFSSMIKPHTIKRFGADYNDNSITENGFQSATAIRNRLNHCISSAADFIPNSVNDIISREASIGFFPCDGEKLSSAVLTNLRLNFSDGKKNIHDAGGGLYNRLSSKSLEATSISSLIDLTGTKKYTTARIRRVAWFSLFGVTSSDLKLLPEYTQVLAMDNIGQALLKKIKKTSEFTIITKSSTELSGYTAKRQKHLADMADMAFQQMKPIPAPGNSIYKKSPFVKGV